ncbi:MAG: Mrp/NBP35 family ATP-binding protein [Planctomycetes bacterium]|nr:Mrp/NBP35 family ATP-binding protein [Planctomycetota bacterium]
MAITREAILAALKGVQDPDLHKDLVDLGMIKEPKADGANIELTVELTTPACPLKDQIGNEITAALKSKLNAANVKLNWTSNTSATNVTAKDLIPGVRNVIMVAAGKGGVGKSTVAANLANALAQHGAEVGLLDADIYGPSMPTMFGIHEQPIATEDQRIIPHVKFGVKVMSMGFLLAEGQAVVWRGPMLDSAIRQFLGQVEWGNLDYLVVDMPPGTGDVQLSLTRMVPTAQAVIVTTPQDVALADVKRAIGMFNTVKINVLGVVENMSGFVCSHCGKKSEIFGHGAGKRCADKYGITYFGEIPLTEEVVKSGDNGKPILVSHPQDPASLALKDMAMRVAQQVAITANKGHPVTA